MDTERLEKNYRRVLDRAMAAAERAHRPRESWRLVAVTKEVGDEAAAALYELGAAELGENRVKELLRKREALSELNVRWHMIGHLQRRKARDIVGIVELIHSVDSPRLAREIEKRAANAGAAQKVLLEVNVSGEESKYGLTAPGAYDLAREMQDYRYTRPAGLMTMAPIVEDAGQTRPIFRNLRELGERLADEGLFAGPEFELSMGMTQDFEVAIEEGATIIRVGSAIFEGVEDER